MATGEAEAIKLKAEATSKGIDAVAGSIREGGDSAQGAVSLSVAEKYVEAFGRLAKEGTAVVVPGNMGDMGGMIASAMAVYGKVSEGQRKMLEGRSVPEAPMMGSETSSLTQDHTSGKSDEVARSVLQGFEETRQKR